MALVLQPVTLREACAFIDEHHRHHDPPRGCLFCVGVSEGETVGWTTIGAAGGGSWSRTGRPRIDTHPTQEKIRWEKTA